MSDPDQGHSQGSFDERLQMARKRHAPDPRGIAAGALAKGTRYAFEMAANAIVGAGLGIMLDRYAGTGPWGFIILLLLGVAAGIWSLMKAVNAEALAIRQAAENDDREVGAENGNQG